MKNSALFHLLHRIRPEGFSVSSVAGFLVAAVVLFGLLGVLAIPYHGQDGSLFRLFDLDRELNLATLYSSALLIACGWLTFRQPRCGRFAGPAVIALGVLFVFMGLDEFFKVHETLEKVTGIDWQILYLPIVCVAGLGWVRLWLEGRWRLFGWLWLGGAAAWALSQLLEAGQWGWWSGTDTKVGIYTPLMIAEELLEMAGSSLFLLSLLLRLQTSEAGKGGPARMVVEAPAPSPHRGARPERNP